MKPPKRKKPFPKSAPQRRLPLKLPQKKSATKLNNNTNIIKIKTTPKLGVVFLLYEFADVKKRLGLNNLHRFYKTFRFVLRLRLPWR